jgi:hypothetical protein
VGLFNKKAKISVCEMCGLADVEGCGSIDKHVVQVRGDEPSWLPSDYRAQAQGEYTFLCTRCNSFPQMKWPGDGGASAAIAMHLGAVHYVGQFKGQHLARIDMTSLG